MLNERVKLVPPKVYTTIITVSQLSVIIILFISRIFSYLLLQQSSEKEQGPVVQSIVNLTSSLGGQLVKCFTTLFTKYTDIFVEK